MRVYCDGCLAEFDVPYWRLGAAYPCPACSQAVHLDRQRVRSYESTGYEVTFSDFVSLVSDAYYQDTILPLVRTWFGLERVEKEQGDQARFRDEAGNVYDAFEVHARIQNDPARQQQLYNNAMTLWH